MNVKSVTLMRSVQMVTVDVNMDIMVTVINAKKASSIDDIVYQKRPQFVELRKVHNI